MINLKNEKYNVVFKSIVLSIILTFVSKIFINYLGIKVSQYGSNETTVSVLGGFLIYSFMVFVVIGLLFMFLYLLMFLAKELHEIMFTIGSIILAYFIFLGIGFNHCLHFNGLVIFCACMLVIYPVFYGLDKKKGSV